MQEIIKLKPYFFSLRELDNNKISLDLRLPSHWSLNVLIDNGFENDKIILQDKDNSFMLISIIENSTLEEINNVFNIANTLIQYNLTEEEKKKLLEIKMEELKKMFLSKPLDELKELNF
jgi:hypothetical protein